MEDNQYTNYNSAEMHTLRQLLFDALRSVYTYPSQCGSYSTTWYIPEKPSTPLFSDETYVALRASHEKRLHTAQNG